MSDDRKPQPLREAEHPPKLVRMDKIAPPPSGRHSEHPPRSSSLDDAERRSEHPSRGGGRDGSFADRFPNNTVTPKPPGPSASTNVAPEGPKKDG